MVNQTYADLLRRLLSHGQPIAGRNGATRRLFAEVVRFEATPLVSVRKTAWRNALREWEWFMSGSSHLANLHPAVRHWWQPWADWEGYVRYNYGIQFVRFCGHDDEYPTNVNQLSYLIDGIRDHPNSRRLCITTWNTADMLSPDCRITNCHGTVIQCFVNPDDTLHLVTYQRSADVVCGLPHNWVQYWAFLQWLAVRGGRRVGSMTWVGGDVHLYETHLSIAEEIVRRVGECTATPELVYTPTSEGFMANDFTLSGEYKPVITTKAEMVV